MRRTWGTGAIYQRSKTGRFTIAWRDGGRMRRETLKTTNRAEAGAILKDRLAKAARGETTTLELTTLNDLLALVETNYSNNRRDSLDRVQQAGKHLQAFFGGETKAASIKADRIAAYAAQRLSDGAQPATINYEQAVLRRAFRLGCKMDKVTKQPEVSMLKVENARKGFFERDQFESVLAKLPEYMRPLFRVAYVTGWRVQSELMTRQWRHVDFANGWMRLDPGEAKNDEGRAFPFTPELRAILEAQRERVRAIERELGRVIPWVFIHPPGTPRAVAGERIADYRGAWRKACRDAGVQRLVHELRRTAVRNLERAGVPRSAAMKMTGHKTEAVYRRYAIVDETMLSEGAAKLAAFHASEKVDRKLITG
jgi:integrase